MDPATDTEKTAPESLMSKTWGVVCLVFWSHILATAILMGWVGTLMDHPGTYLWTTALIVTAFVGLARMRRRPNLNRET